ncbi:MAG: uroporphyrinogen decarboxylase family protein [Bacteroidota bacterium]
MKIPSRPSEPDIENLYKTLRREKADRPVLFEFIVNLDICQEAAQLNTRPEQGSLEYYRMIIDGFKNLGYDHAPVYTVGSDIYSFEKGNTESLDSRSQNQGALITDHESFEKYRWRDAKSANYDIYHQLSAHLPDGMKLLGFSNGGILENATDIVGFENLATIYLMDPGLAREVFDNIGKQLLEFYSIISSIESVGACVVNDDWGFKTQSIFPPEMMEEYVFPYTRKIVQAIHDNGKPAILHSCGYLKELMNVIIDDLKLDGKHSFEDGIYPVEDAWEWWHDRIAIMGGIDVDYLARRSPEEIYQRAMKLLEQTFDHGGYALGSGNSIPGYIPRENYFAMLRAAADFNR